MKPTRSLPSAQNPVPEAYYDLAVTSPHLNVLFTYGQFEYHLISELVYFLLTFWRRNYFFKF